MTGGINNMNSVNSINKIITATTAATLMAALSLTAVPVRAAQDRPELTLTLRAPQQERLADGALIASGRVQYRGPHGGYRVWLEAPKHGAAPERYVLSGKNSPRHRVSVRLGGEGWVPDREGPHGGVLRQTADQQVSIDIVADGDQQVAADQYRITANAMIITP